MTIWEEGEGSGVTQSMLSMSPGTQLDEQAGSHGETPRSRFSFYLGNVTIGHFVAIGILLLIPVLWHTLFHRKPKESFRVDFVVDVSQLRGSGGAPRGGVQSDPGRLRVVNVDKLRAKIEEKQRKEREKAEKAEKERLEKEKKEQELKDALAAKNINTNSPTITREFPPVNRSANPGPKLTDEEISRRLAQGATAGDHTTRLEGDALNLAKIRGQLNNAWSQPSHAEVGNAVAEVTLKFAPDGRIISAALTQKTGVPSMDSSVMEAVNSVTRVDGVSEDFLKYHSEITVDFKVTPE
jgi:hypothetical protein